MTIGQIRKHRYMQILPGRIGTIGDEPSTQICLGGKPLKGSSLWSLLRFLAIWSVLGCWGSANAMKPTDQAANESLFVGRWDIMVNTGESEYPTWLEVKRDADGLKLLLVGRVGNARPVEQFEIHGSRLTFSAVERFESKETVTYESTVASGVLTGFLTRPSGVVMKFVGRRAPELKLSVVKSWGKPIRLFNGRDLSGWKMQNPEAGNWVVEKGVLTNLRRGSNLVTTSDFEDFKLHIEFNCPARCNSGVYLRGRYEVQIEDNSESQPPTQRIGAIYGFLAPEQILSRRPGNWQSFDIMLVGRAVTVKHNDKLIINNREIPGITGGALDSHEELPGPIFLQGDHTGLTFRNIVIVPASK